MPRAPYAAEEPFKLDPLERFAAGFKLLEVVGDHRDSSEGAGTWVGRILGLGRKMFPDLPPIYRAADLEACLAACYDGCAVTFSEWREAYDMWKALAADYRGQCFDRDAELIRLLPAGFDTAGYLSARDRIERRLERLQDDMLKGVR